MEAIPLLETDDNHMHPSQGRLTTMAGLICDKQGSQFLPSDPDNAMGAPLRKCQLLVESIKCP